MIRIYSGRKSFFLAGETTLSRPDSDVMVTRIDSESEMALAYKELSRLPNIAAVYFFGQPVKTLLEWFSAQFVTVHAAGGLVRNSAGQLLFIYRNGKWDLPKGKLEKGESPEIASVREVEEECGIQGLTRGKLRDITYHIYEDKGQQILKPTHWYDMRTTDSSKPVPQQEEGITEVRWIAKEDLAFVRENTYESILQVLAAGEI
jgi:8-oxo-dGTP pyrophosphatase MutT (NUDIX family)